MKPRINVLILDDEPAQTQEVCEYLTRVGYDMRSASRPSEAFRAFEDCPPDILILDLRLPEMNGLEVLKRIRTGYPRTEVIMITGHGDIDSVIDSMRLGAFDFIRKPLRLIDLQASIERTGKYLELSHAYKKLEESHSLISNELQRRINANIVGRSWKIRQVIDQARIASEHHDTNVVITGESGSGKELVAQIIHYNSARKDRMFCDINCAAISPSLFESEFFGHARGAFTSAVIDKKGYLEMADGGALLLDELLDLPLDLQPKLLRTLETGRLRRVGSNREIPVNIRIISTTISSLEDAVRAGKFRLDLFHRLSTIRIEIPPLRERLEDVEVLVDHFLNQFANRMGRTPPCPAVEIANRLGSYSFPGNVRELRNLVERIMIFSASRPINEIIDETLARRPVMREEPTAAPVAAGIESAEREAIVRALEAADYHQQNASQILGVTRQTLARKIRRYQIPLFRR
jgi:DNA-binding NtrC family response regulator